MADPQRINADSLVNHHAVTPLWEDKSKAWIAQWFSDNGFARGYNSNPNNWNGLINPFTGQRSYAQAHAVGQRVTSATPDATASERTKGYRIFWIVQDPWGRITYGAGNWEINRRAINVEHLGDYRNYALRENDMKVIADFWRGRDRQLSGNTAVYGHLEVSQLGTACPARIMEGRNRIVQLINAANSGWPAVEPPKPSKPTWKPMDTPRHMLTAEKLRVYDLVKGSEIGDPIAANVDIDFRQITVWNGKTYLRSKYSTDNNLDQGIEANKLKEIPKPEPKPEPEPQPEPVVPVRTEQVDMPGTYRVINDTKLVTMPDGKPYTADVYQKGLIITVFDKITFSDGSAFYRTKYSADKSLFVGFNASDLEPYTQPDPEPTEPSEPTNPEQPGDKDEPTMPEQPTTPPVSQTEKDARKEAIKTVGRNGLLAAISALLASLVNWLLDAVVGLQLPTDVVVGIGAVIYAGFLWLDNFLHVKGKQVESKVKGLIGF